MTIQQAIQILERHNKWRRADEMMDMADPKTLGIAIDTIVNHHKTHNTPEPPPKQGKQEVMNAVIEDMKQRREDGIEKYGTPLMTHNGRNALVDAYQEVLDLAVYIKQELLERSTQ